MVHVRSTGERCWSKRSTTSQNSETTWRLSVLTQSLWGIVHPSNHDMISQKSARCFSVLINLKMINLFLFKIVGHVEVVSERMISVATIALENTVCW